MDRNTLIALGFIVILVLGGTALISVASKSLGGILDWVKYGFDDIGGSQDDYCALGATLHFEDGTEEEVQLDTGFPFTVYFEDDPRVLLSIDFKLWGSFTYDGKITKIGRDATLEFDFDSDGTAEKTVITTTDLPYIPESGTDSKLTELTVTASNLESYAPSEGQYSSTVTGRATLEITFQDGNVESISSGDVTGTFNFTVDQMGATSPLSVYISYQKWHDTPK